MAAVGRLEGADVPIPIETAKRLTCGDIARRTLTEDQEGGVLDVGRRTRPISPALKRALFSRDEETCRFPGCSHTRWLHAHHVRHWADGGDTCLDNLVVLCSFHHRLVYEGGFALTTYDARLVSVTDPRGKTVEPVPPLGLVDLRNALEDRLLEDIEADPYALAPPFYDGHPFPLVEVVDNLLRASASADGQPNTGAEARPSAEAPAPKIGAEDHASAEAPPPRDTMG